jgi:hypothetical protein
MVPAGSTKVPASVMLPLVKRTASSSLILAATFDADEGDADEGGDADEEDDAKEAGPRLVQPVRSRVATTEMQINDGHNFPCGINLSSQKDRCAPLHAGLYCACFAIASARNGMKQEERWPALPFAAWKDTYATLHMWTQMVGKVRLALSPNINHYWGTTFYVTARGLTTSAILYDSGIF